MSRKTDYNLHSYFRKSDGLRSIYRRNLERKGKSRKKYTDGKAFRKVCIRFDSKNMFFAHAYEKATNKRKTIRTGYHCRLLLIDHLLHYGFEIESREPSNICSDTIIDTITRQHREWERIGSRPTITFHRMEKKKPKRLVKKKKILTLLDFNFTYINSN